MNGYTTRTDDVVDDDLAARLAENVMGWGIHKTGYNWAPQCMKRHWCDKTDGDQMLVSDWDPLHNDAQAMMVLDRMHKRRFSCTIRSSVANDSWQVEFVKWPCNVPAAKGKASSRNRKEAICRAAKAAIEAERAERATTCAYCGSVLE